MLDFFRVMIEGVEPEGSFFQFYWSPGTHIGEAIESVLGACVRIGIENPIAREADYFEFDSLPEDAVEDKRLKIWYMQERYRFPSEKSFIAPLGIIGSSQIDENDYELLKEGFSRWTTEEGIYELEAAIERGRLFNTFVELMARLPSIKVFWIRLAPDWEYQDREEFWTNEKLDSAEAITSFLTSHSDDTFANGYVGLTAYSDVGQTNLTIDTHKTIKVLTKSVNVQEAAAAALQSLGFEELPEFHSLEYRYYHWHYRPTRSKSRSKLIAALKKWGFSLWKEHKVEPELTSTPD